MKLGYIKQMSWLELGAYNGYQGLNYVILDVYRGFN